MSNVSTEAQAAAPASSPAPVADVRSTCEASSDSETESVVQFTPLQRLQRSDTSSLQVKDESEPSSEEEEEDEEDEDLTEAEDDAEDDEEEDEEEDDDIQHSDEEPETDEEPDIEDVLEALKAEAAEKCRTKTDDELKKELENERKEDPDFVPRARPRRACRDKTDKKIKIMAELAAVVVPEDVGSDEDDIKAAKEAKKKRLAESLKLIAGVVDSYDTTDNAAGKEAVAADVKAHDLGVQHLLREEIESNIECPKVSAAELAKAVAQMEESQDAVAAFFQANAGTEVETATFAGQKRTREELCEAAEASMAKDLEAIAEARAAACDM